MKMYQSVKVVRKYELKDYLNYELVNAANL